MSVKRGGHRWPDALFLGVFVVFALGIAVSPASGVPVIYTSPTSFNSAIAGLGSPTVVDFEDIDASPVNNTFFGRTPFDGNHYAAQGITFSNLNGYPLYIAPGGLFWNASNSLSVGRFPFDPYKPDLYNNDDDLVVARIPACVAVGFTLVDAASGQSGEVVQFIDADGLVVDQVVGFPAPYAPYRAFVGIVSVDRPIAMINVVEAANDGDDINYDDFICVPVPEPATLILLGSGLVAVAVARPSRRRHG